MLVFSRSGELSGVISFCLFEFMNRRDDLIAILFGVFFVLVF